MLLPRVDRHGHCAGADPDHADGDFYPDLRTDGNRHASNPDPQPDPADRNGHHHPDIHLYADGDLYLNPNLYPDPHPHVHPLPACHGNFHTLSYSQPDQYSHTHPHSFPHRNLYFQPIAHELCRNIHSFDYSLPHNPIT